MRSNFHTAFFELKEEMGFKNMIYTKKGKKGCLPWIDFFASLENGFLYAI